MYANAQQWQLPSIPVIVGDEVDSNAEVAKTPRTANAVKIRLGMFRKVKVYDNVDSLNVNAASKQVCTEQQFFTDFTNMHKQHY